MLAGRLFVLIGLVACLSACRMNSQLADAPAVITNPTEASRASLQATINAALNTEVLLADDALTASSILAIEATPPGSIEHPVPDGRNPGRPVRFQLVISNSACVLIDERNQSRYELSNTTCKAE